MLSSITPFGERGRHNRYAVTSAFFVAGAVAGGAALGALAGVVGGVVLPDRPATAARTTSTARILQARVSTSR